MEHRVRTGELSIASIGHALSLLVVISYLPCIGLCLIVSAEARMYKAGVPLLPGFEWLTLSGFLFGLVGSYRYAWHVAVVILPLYRICRQRV